jgi:serine/threonine-protein kinase
MLLEPGQIVLDRYVVERLLGEGGMGQVYLGRHARLGLPVALKVLTDRSIPDLASRFEREAMLMARVRHPNVVGILDFGLLADGSPCIAMEFVEGESLSDRLKNGGAIPWPQAQQLMLGILAGLEAMHAAGVLHRDLKPSNILILPGRTEMAKLIDFGIAQPTGMDAARLTRTGMVVGTPAYMPPEQILCYPLDERTDVYAAGLILWEMLAGRLPFDVNDVSAVMRRLIEPFPDPDCPANLPPLPAALVTVLASALAAEADSRPANARDFAERLQASCGSADRVRQPEGGGAVGPDRPLTRQAGRDTDVSPSQHVSRPPSRPGSQAPSQPGSQAPSRPGPQAPSRPGSQAPSQPGSQAPSQPGSKAPSRPGPQAPSRPPSRPSAILTPQTGRPPAPEGKKRTVVPSSDGGSEGMEPSEVGFAPTMLADSAVLSSEVLKTAPDVPAPVTRGMLARERGTQRFLVVARLPPSRLANAQDRRWLAQAAGPGTRSYSLGGQFWFALQTTPSTAAEATGAVEALAAAVRAQYGETATVEWRLVDSGFHLPMAALTGNAPLPEALAELIARTTAQPGTE